MRLPSASIVVSSYYNCFFRADTVWRAFELGIRVYCARTEEWCEQLYGRLAGGGDEAGTAIIQYPPENVGSICDDDQARLLSWQPG